jgi:hypothetical protein
MVTNIGKKPAKTSEKKVAREKKSRGRNMTNLTHLNWLINLLKNWCLVLGNF